MISRIPVLSALTRGRGRRSRIFPVLPDRSRLIYLHAPLAAFIGAVLTALGIYLFSSEKAKACAR